MYDDIVTFHSIDQFIEPLLSRLSAYRMLLAQFVTRTAVTFAVTLHGFTEPVLKLLYRVLAWSAFSHFLPAASIHWISRNIATTTPKSCLSTENHKY